MTSLGSELHTARLAAAITQPAAACRAHLALHRLANLESDGNDALVSELVSATIALGRKLVVKPKTGFDFEPIELSVGLTTSAAPIARATVEPVALKEAFAELAHIARTKRPTVPVGLVVDFDYLDQVVEQIWHTEITPETDWATLPTFQDLPVSLAPGLSDQAELIRLKPTPRWPLPIATTRLVPRDVEANAALYRALRDEGTETTTATEITALASSCSPPNF